jgi:glycosyltransferase involved in cell wall biosynthesis
LGYRSVKALAIHQSERGSLRIAVVHDWLVTYGGADRVLEQILACYPGADLFSLVDFLPANMRGFILEKPVQTSFFQNLPFARNSFRKYFPLMPLAVEQFDLSAYDLVISSSHSIAKGVITGPDQLHICVCYSPMRYAWDLQHQYLQESGLDRGIFGWPTRWLLHEARLWDTRTANGVDEFVAISHFIARRIWKTYRRESTVIYPPVDVESVSVKEDKDDFYLTVSRLVPYKKVNLIVEAFCRMPDKKLVVIGDGTQFKSIKAAASKNIVMLGYQNSQVVHDHMQRARCFVFAAEEDFGITVLEAQAAGTPVIAFGKGGALETIRDLSSEEPTGTFFREQTPQSIINAVCLFEIERGRLDAWACRRNAERFSRGHFRREFQGFCERAVARFKTGVKPSVDGDLFSDVAVQVSKT